MVYVGCEFWFLGVGFGGKIIGFGGRGGDVVWVWGLWGVWVWGGWVGLVLRFVMCGWIWWLGFVGFG